ncbi:MAG: disulfide bond formation protein B [Bacteriovoracia bacterium]
MDNWFKLFVLWIVSVGATTGSLFFSEVMLLPPCLLCWYQRIAMYPLVLLFGLALFPLDMKVIRYALPLTLIGWGIAVYHNLLYYKLIPEHMAPCTQGISCTTVQLEWLGFITIPLLSLVAFTIILSGLIHLRKSYEV